MQNTPGAAGSSWQLNFRNFQRQRTQRRPVINKTAEQRPRLSKRRRKLPQSWKYSTMDSVSMDFSALLPQRMQDTEEEDEGCSLLPTLTFQERIIGCVSCMVFGYILSFGSFLRFKELILGNPGESFNGTWKIEILPFAFSTNERFFLSRIQSRSWWTRPLAT